MRVNNFPLKNKFIAISAIAFCIIGALVFVVTQNQVRAFFLAQEKADFVKDVQDKADQSFNLDLPLSLKTNGNIETFIKELKKETDATDLKLLDPNGVAVYSVTPVEVGQNFSDNQKIKSAIGGTTVLDSPNTNALTQVAYVPIKSSGGEVRGVLVGKTKLDTKLLFIRNFSLQLDAIIMVIAFAFGLSIYFVFSTAEADMIEKDHSLVDQSRAFEEEKQLDDAIMASIAESLAVINKDGQIMLFNPAAERITGLQSSEVEYRLYRKILTFHDKDGKEQSKNPITETLKTSQPTQIAVKDGYYIKNQKHELIPVSVSIAPILDGNQKIQGVAATIQDVSAEKELDAVKDEFVYVVAHELGNPIFALDGYLSILQDQTKKADKTTQNLISSARAVDSQLSELVNDLLEVVRNEQGTLKFDLEQINLAEIAENVIQNAQFKAKDKKITLEYKKSKQTKAIGNKQKIKEVLTNLIDNALKYTPEGGKDWVVHQMDGLNLVTYIRDNGYGISASDQEKLFSKFYRVKTKNTADISGTGLGLFICRQIVEKCGGTVWADSAEGKGSTFYFSLNTTKK